MASNDPTGSLLPSLRTRFCLESPEGFIGAYTIVSDPTPLFTRDAAKAHQFATWDAAIRAAYSVLHLYPNLTVREVRFKKTQDSWHPV